jgi:Indolepyruvate ferredoxin oxidoreductase, alpha and beta subunits
MPEIVRPYSGKPNPCFNYIDLDKWQDDKTVLKNPHKGWYWHYIDNGYGRINYRQNLESCDYMKDFPGLNHLYLRFDWGDIEAEENVLDWSYIDSIMDEWGSQGYRFSFRICTYEGAAHPDSIKYATPKWVYDAGAEYIELDGGRIEPVYSDPIYLEKLENFMKKYGEKFNNDDRVEFIDVGSFGTWGENHTFNGSGTIYPNEVLYKHILLHTKYFPDKYVLLNDDMVGHRGNEPEEEKQKIVDFAKTLGCGARDDSICVAGYSYNYNYDTLRSPYFFEQLWRDAPVDIEYEHYTSVLKDKNVFRDGLPFIEALRNVHATYAGFHGLPRPWLENNYYLTEYIANRLGYWYFIDGIRLTDFVYGCNNYMEIIFENRGFAHAYNKYALKIKLTDSNDKEYIFDAVDCDCRLWMPNEKHRERIKLTTKDLPTGTYKIHCGLFEDERPIQFAMQAEREFNGWYYLSDVNIICL